MSGEGFRAVVLGLVASAASVDTPALAQSLPDPVPFVQARERESEHLAAQWLASSDPRLQAWGAYVAMRDRRNALLPALAGLVSRAVSAGVSRADLGVDRHAALASVLDAIIQLDGRVPVSDAAALYETFPVQSLILLSFGQRGAAGHLLQFFSRTDTPPLTWGAIGNLLANSGPQTGFAAAVLTGFVVRVAVRVTDSGSRPPRGSGFAGSCPDGPLQPRAGWPLVGNYRVSRRGTLLAAGAVPSYYERVEGGADPGAPQPDARCPGYLSPFERQHVRARLLTRLASLETAPVRDEAAETLEWNGEARYSRDVAALIGRHRARLEEVASRLQDRGLLTAVERASATPLIEITIIDARASRRMPLPTLRGVGRDVRIEVSVEAP